MMLVLVQCSTTNTDDTTSIEVPAELKKLVLISPANGAKDQAATVEFNWKIDNNAQNYHLMIAEDANFDSTLVDELLETKSYTATLEAGQTYYWKTRVLRDGETGPWSDTWNFTTAFNQKEPVTVALVSPEDGDLTEAGFVAFEWENIGENSEYHFQVAEDAEFNTIVEDSVVNTAGVEVAEFSAQTQYYWRVSPIMDSETGTWSEIRSFMTDSEPVATEPPVEVPSSGFVYSQNADFMLNGQRFSATGSNAYHLPNYEKIDPSVVNRAMDAFEDAGVNVIRMWGFYDGQPQYNGDITLQPDAGVYSEENLKKLDNVIAKSQEHGVRVILTLINYWDQLGGIRQYNTWAGNPDGGMPAFINGEQQQKWFKDYISMLLNRVNTVTGVAYKDDPAIFAWEIMNEGRNRGQNPQIIRDWYQDIAQYIKSIDKNHMVSTGEEGFDEGTPAQYSKDQYSNTYILRAQEGTSYVMNTEIPEIDYGTAHWYPADWGWYLNSWDLNSSATQNLLNAQDAWLKDHIDIAENVGKPFLMGEYGFPGWGDDRQKNIYKDYWKYSEEVKVDGNLLWQLTPDYTKCSEYGGNICYPGGRGDEELYNDFKNHNATMQTFK